MILQAFARQTRRHRPQSARYMTVRCQRSVTSSQYAGTLVKIGGSDMPADAMKDIIAATDRAAAGPTAPAHGLTMIGLKYE